MVFLNTFFELYTFIGDFRLDFCSMLLNQALKSCYTFTLFLSSTNHLTEKAIYDMWLDLEVKGTMSAGFQCTKCDTTQGDQNPENHTFKYEYMRKHVFEHGRGDHSHCKE